MDEERILKSIRSYQESLDRHTENRNDSKLLYYINKLSKLPVSVSHLEATGVGRTMNGLRKWGGEVGDLSKTIVAKWKQMVMDESESANVSPVPEPNQPTHVNEENRKSSSNHHHSENRSRSEDKSKKHKHSSKDDDRHRDSSRKDKHNKESKVSGHSSDHKQHKNEKKRHRSDDDDEQELRETKRHPSTSPSNSPSSDSSEEEIIRNHNKTNELKRKISSDSSEDDEKKMSDEKKIKLDTTTNNKDKNKSSSKHESSLSKTKSYNKYEKKDKHHKRDEGKHSSSSNNSSKADRHDSKKSRSDTNDKKDKNKKEGSKDHHKKEEKSKHSKNNKNDNNSAIKDGIDSGSGASFAEALGMCGPSSSSNKSSSKKKIITEEKISNNTNVNNREKAASKSENDCNIPKLLKESNLEPIDINISSLLPTITPNYRPLKNAADNENVHKRTLSEYEALSHIISSKNQRTKVYSGNKTGCGLVPKLFDLCIRILQDNIDALEYTGGVPYEILKPIIEKATPEQLENLEYHNPYLVQNTGELWQLHVQKQFRNKHREELESWRDMYARCLCERDAKLKALTANIKQAQDKSIPVRTTKLAYVNDVVKPPRNIARQQVKSGINRFDKKPTVTPSSRLSALAIAGDAGKIAVPNPGARAADRSSGNSAFNKPKKAPLMAKSLSLLKNRFRR